MNTLKITFCDKVKVGNRVFFWVFLETEKEIRACCYSRYNGSWCYDDGDAEPKMSDELRALFHGKKGNAALNKCYKTGDEVTIEA